MTDDTSNQGGANREPPGAQARRERQAKLEQALRANLRRRKAAAADETPPPARRSENGEA